VKTSIGDPCPAIADSLMERALVAKIGYVERTSAFLMLRMYGFGE